MPREAPPATATFRCVDTEFSRYGAGRITGAKWSEPSSRAVAEPTPRPRGWLFCV